MLHKAALGGIAAAALVGSFLSIPGWAWAVFVLLCCVLVIRLRTATSIEDSIPADVSDKLFVGIYEDVTRSLASAIAAQDCYTGMHVSRSEKACELVAQQMNIDRDTIRAMRIAVLVQDVGKLAVPSHILLKAGPLDPEEASRVRNHAAIGADILEKLDDPWNIAGMIRHHHEKYDGSGYPDKLAGDQIPLGSRIIAVVAVYDALISDRCYRKGWSHREAVEHIQQLAGTQFDPAVVEAFLAVEPQIAELANLDDGGHTDAACGVSDYATADIIAQANRELVCLLELSQILSSTLEIDEVLTMLAHRTNKLMHAATCAVFVTDEHDPKRLVARAAVGEHEPVLAASCARVGKGVIGKVVSRNAAHIGNCDRNDLKTPKGDSTSVDAKSCMVVPITSFGKVLGTLNLYSMLPTAFFKDDLCIVSFIAHQAAVAIQNASTFEAVRDSAMRDPVTDLYNGRYLKHFLDNELSRASRFGHPVSVIQLDLDDFKSVNDTNGHEAGDIVLKDVAAILRKALRDYDVAARHGGDEFAVVLPGASPNQARHTAQRIQREINTYAAQAATKGIAQFGASVGIASYPGDAQDAKGLMSKADAAMYRDKRTRKRDTRAA